MAALDDFLRRRSLNDGVNPATRPTAAVNNAMAPTTRSRPSATLQPIPYPNVGLGPGTGVTGPQTGSRATQTAQTSTRQPTAVPRRQLSPQATNTGQSANERVNRALAIRQGMGGVQGSRGEVEQGANRQLGESLRMNLIEQERLRKNAQIPGRMNPVEFRAMQAEMAANQQAVDSGIAATNAMREGQVTRAGQLTEAETTLQDRAMAEAGAFDRAGLQIDVAETQGRFGLEEQALLNRGAVALVPREQFGLDLLRQRQESVDAFGTPQEKAQFTNSAINSTFGAAPLGNPNAQAEPVPFTIPGEDGMPGTEVLLNPQDAVQLSNYLVALSNPEFAGITPEMRKQDIADIQAGRKTAEQVTEERRAQMAADAEERRRRGRETPQFQVGQGIQNAFGLGPN